MVTGRRFVLLSTVVSVLCLAPSLVASTTAAAAPVTDIIVNFAGSPNGAPNPGSPAPNPGDGGPATSATLGSPMEMAVDPAGNLYIADNYTGQIRKVDTKGIITSFAGGPARAIGNSGDGGPAASSILNSPAGVAADSAGNVYIADTGNNRIRKVDIYGIITNFAGSASRIVGNTGDGGRATAALLDYPTAVAVDPAGDVYIADTGNKRIRKVDTNGVITNFAGNAMGTFGYTGDGGPATSAYLADPTGVAADAAGDVYIDDYQADRIRKVDARGIITNFAGAPLPTPGYTGDGGPATSALLQAADAVAVDSTGNVFIVDWGNERIRKVDTAGIITTFAGSAGIGNSGDGGPATSATFSCPQGVTVDSSANVYISDGCTYRVREVLAKDPAFTSVANTTLTVGAAASFAVKVAGFPATTVTEVGTLPHGLTFNSATATLSGTPAQGTAGSYPITFHAANTLGTATQAFILTVDQATLTHPVNGQLSVTTPATFTWSTIPGAQHYYLVIGTTLYGAQLVNSGVLPPSTTSYRVPTLPAGPVLYATLLVQVNGTWGYEVIGFTAR
jgi:hypothetical protein